MRKIAEQIWSVGVQDWDRRLFDELIPLPEGTSYNAYLIKGSEKTALLDTVDPTKTELLVDHLIRVGVEKIDYLISHHAEQDHSGSIPDILLLYPDAKVVANPKCKSMLIDHLHLQDEQFIEVQDGQELSLGDKTLQFIYTPWVHWPETMCTFAKQDRILFSCDFFGSHLASSDLFVADAPRVLRAAKRYYGEIMMPFRTTIRNNLQKIAPLGVKMIAPSHGPVYDEPSLIFKAYQEWVEDGHWRNHVVVPFVSMHDSTRKMAEYFVDALIERGVGVSLFNLTTADLGEIVIELVDSPTVILGSPTVLIGAHPTAMYAAALINALRPKIKHFGIIGSFGWGSKMVEQVQSLLGNVKAEIFDPILSKGMADDSVYAELDGLADKIVQKHKALGLM